VHRLPREVLRERNRHRTFIKFQLAVIRRVHEVFMYVCMYVCMYVWNVTLRVSKTEIPTICKIVTLLKCMESLYAPYTHARTGKYIHTVLYLFTYSLLSLRSPQVHRRSNKNEQFRDSWIQSIFSNDPL